MITIRALNEGDVFLVQNNGEGIQLQLQKMCQNRVFLCDDSLENRIQVQCLKDKYENL